MSLNAHLFGILFPTTAVYEAAWLEAGYPYYEISTEQNRHLDLDVNGIVIDEGDYSALTVSLLGGYTHSLDNARLVALSDNQLVFLLSLMRKTEYPEAWHMAWGDTGTSTPAYPSQPLNGWAYGRVRAWLEDLKEQLMVDVRPELNAMVAAQNEMSDDLDAIRISLQQIAADIDAADNAEKLENIANMIGLLVTLL